MNAGEPDGWRGGRIGALLFAAVVVTAALTPWLGLGVGVVGAASCTTVSGGEDGIVISEPGCYLIEGGQSDGDEEDSDTSTFVDVQTGDVVLDGNGNTIDGIGSGEAVRVDGNHSNVTVRNVTLTDWSTGIYVKDADAVTVEDVTVRSGGTGVTIDTTTNATVRRVNVSNNTDYGVYLKGSPGGVLANLTADGNTKSDVHLDDSDGATVRDATLTGGGAHGLFVKNSPNASVLNVAAASTNVDGIGVDSSGNTTVRNSVVRSVGRHGVLVKNSPGASVVGVTVEDVSLDGVHVDSSDAAVVRDSTARRAGQHGVHVTDSKANASIRNNTATNNTDDGFRIRHSDGSVAAGNTARDNGAAGIRVSSELATVRDSLFERNADGIYLDTHSHVVENNTLRANDYGITLDGDDTTVVHNRVVGSTTAGFHYVSGKDDLIYDNLFNNSKNTAYDTDPDPSNRWNVSTRAGTNVLGGSVVGGNAWFDPGGTGHSETGADADADGFTDANYTVFETSVDELPLDATDAALTVTPASHDFGTLMLPSVSTKEFVVRNPGDANVTVDRTSIEGLNALMFTIENDPTPVTLAPGENVSVNVTFAPTVTGLLDGTLAVESDTAGVSDVNATLSGTGIDDGIPTAEAGPSRTVDDGTVVSFDATNSTDDVGIVSYEWDFGDGDTSTGATANHTYASIGTYTVTLNVSDGIGNTDTDASTVTVSDVTAPVTDAGANRTVDDGTAVSFDGTNSTDDVGVVSYAWEFGDGSTSTGTTPTHTYAAPGNYTVTLNATDAAGNLGTDTATVSVSDITAPTAAAGPNRTVDDGTAVTFDGTNSTDDTGVVSYAWEFGDGSTTTGTTPTHTYDTPGTYSVTLNVTDGAGNTDVDTITITVSDATVPMADAGPNRTIDEDVSITLDGRNSTDDVGVVSYAWDFGDGNGSTGATANHSYAAPGTYTVTLTATDAAGNAGTDVLAITVDPSDASDGDSPDPDGDDANEGSSDGSGVSGGGGGPVVAEPSGEVGITDRTLLNETVSAGAPVVVRVGLSNPDPVRGRLALALAANGSVVAERTVAVGMSASRTVPLRTTFETPGRYSLAVNGAGVGTVEVTARSATNRTGNASEDDTELPRTPPSPGNGTAAVDIEGSDGPSVAVSVNDIESGREVPVEFGDETPSTGDVSFGSISFTPTEGDPISMNVTASRDPLPGAPEFDRRDNTSGLAHLRVEHSIANEDVDGAAVRFGVSAARLERLDTAPGDVALYRYQNGSWAELPTRVVGETDDGYAFLAESPGLSEFAAGAKQPQFELRTASVEVGEVRVGDEMRVLVRITNTGGADGTYTAKLLLDEAVVEERRLTIASNGTRQVRFDRRMERPGTYRVLVNDYPAGDVVVSGDAAPTTPPGAPPDDGRLPFELGIGVLSALAILSGVLYRRR